jgi:hypothetical protein
MGEFYEMFYLAGTVEQAEIGMIVKMHEFREFHFLLQRIVYIADVLVPIR